MKLKFFTNYIAFVAALIGVIASTHAATKLPPPPIHPDTLPTLIQAWSLPAALIPSNANRFAPRMTLDAKTLYVFDHHGLRLVAANAESGKVLWHAPTPTRSAANFAVTPLVAREHVYVGTDGYVYCFDTATGKKTWEVATKGVVVNGMARSRHMILFPWIRVEKGRGLPGVGVWALDSRSGRVLWSQGYRGNMAYLQADAEGVYYVGDDGTILGLTPDRGEPRWKLSIDGEITTPPLLKGNTLYITAERRKAGWRGTGIYAVNVQKGDVIWQSKLASTTVSAILHNGKLVTVEADGRVAQFDDTGKETWSFDLAFGDAPQSLKAVSDDERIYVFSSHVDGNGYVWLLDPAKQRVIATANALDQSVFSMQSAEKMVILDGKEGDLYAYRLDRSNRPDRDAVPAPQFARELIQRAELQPSFEAKALAIKLAGLGNASLSVVEDALQSPNATIVAAAAQTITMLESRNSTPALLAALDRFVKSASASVSSDPVLLIVNALAALKDPRAIKPLERIMLDSNQSHHRRRSAYVALGSLGTPQALNPLWTWRAKKQQRSSAWKPQGITPSLEHSVELDFDPTTWPDEVRKRTSIAHKAGDGKLFTASLSSYLGGYNDIWIGESDANGAMTTPLFTGLTKPEVLPEKRIRFRNFEITSEGKLSLTIEIEQKQRWVTAKPITMPISIITQDTDGDGLSDLVEKRLQTCVTHPDCDGDGIKDSDDINPLASSNTKLTDDQQLFQEAFFAYYSFLDRRGVVVVDPGNNASVEFYGRQDPVLALRRASIEKLKQEIGLHGTDFIAFGGPYPARSGSGEALPKIEWNDKKTFAKLGMDIVRSGDNAVAYNVSLKKTGGKWVVIAMERIWTTANN